MFARLRINVMRISTTTIIHEIQQQRCEVIDFVCLVEMRS